MFRQSWFRRAGIAFMLLASMAASSLGLHYAADRDAACNPILVAHDASAHYIGVDPAPDARTPHGTPPFASPPE